jgi:hypothetical protein
MRRFLAVEHELGERVAAAFRTPTIEISGVYYLQRRAA